MILLVKQMIVHTDFTEGLEVVWHQHNGDVNMCQPIDLQWKTPGVIYAY